MRNLANEILSTAPSSLYADVRVMRTESQSIATKDGVVEALSSSTSFGYGIRVLKNGAWGFSSSNDTSKKGIEQTMKKAISIAETTARFSSYKVKLSDHTPVQATYKSTFAEDPFAVSMEEKLQILLQADKAQRVDPQVVISQTSFSAHREEKVFASTTGSLIDQTIIWCGAGIEASAAGHGDFQNRTYPNSAGGQFATRGFELIRELQLGENAARVGEEAVTLLTADVCPSGESDLILDSNQLALQIHESCGHAAELDRVLGYEASYAGTSFLTTDKLGTCKYGSEIVNLTADATAKGGLGTFGYDDEGVEAQKTFLVKNGLFVDYITSRETAHELHGIRNDYNRPSNGTMRATSWQYLPLIRMTNISLEPGSPQAGSGKAWKLKDLIADTDDGVFMSSNRSWSIDDRRLNFQFGTEIAWEIKHGKKTRLLKNPTYQGMTPTFWGSCDAICSKDEWTIWGLPNCGKGQPPQVIATGHGASPARFRKVKIGVI